uniref:Uncharacterized protein n=1 Tax=Glossina austeni TaxID=7395 RepID=A0A1A9VMS4_GLOAU
MLSFTKYRLCFLAGCYAAGGSFFGKMPSVLTKQNIFDTQLPIVGETYSYYCALQISEQTLFATVLTTATNYIITFVLGAFVYQEPITSLSILGTSVILLGLWFLCDE